MLKRSISTKLFCPLVAVSLMDTSAFLLRPIAKSILRITEVHTMQDGSKYAGVLVNSKRWGEGDSWDKKGHYKGQWINNVKSGHGVFKFANSCVYEGAFANDMPNGHGRMILGDGKVLEGMFVNGALPSQPKFLPALSDKKVFKLHQQLDRLHQQAPAALQNIEKVEQLPNKSTKCEPSIHTYPWGRYEGYLQNFLPHGSGRMIFLNGELKEGYFCEGKACGHVKYTDRDGTRWEGEFANDLLVSGSVTYKSGLVKEGTFVDGELNGKGKLSRPNRHSYVGRFAKGVPCGYGRATLPDGAVCEGSFANGIFHGKIHARTPDGGVAEFDYFRGEFQPYYTWRSQKKGIVTGTMIVRRVPNFLERQLLPNHTNVDKINLSGPILLHGPVRTIYPNGSVEDGLLKCFDKYGKWKTTHPDGRVTIKDHTPRWVDKVKVLLKELILLNFYL